MIIYWLKTKICLTILGNAATSSKLQYSKILKSFVKIVKLLFKKNVSFMDVQFSQALS